MNYFSHYYALPKNDDPYLTLGSILPDMLRNAKAELAIINQNSEHEVTAILNLNKGILNHLELDRNFHNSDYFFKHTKQIAATIRDSEEISMNRYTQFYAHILLELLIDHILINNKTNELDKFYTLLNGIKFDVIEMYFNTYFPSQDVELFWEKFTHFKQRKFLNDYTNLNKVVDFSFYVYEKTTKQEIIESEKSAYISLINNSFISKIKEHIYAIFAPTYNQYK